VISIVTKIIYISVIFLLFIIGFILTLSGIIRYRKPKGFLKTEGTIQTKKGFRLDHGKPRVIYEVNNISYMYDSHIGQQSGLRNGKKVTILYDANNPKHVYIDNFIQRGGRRIVFGLFMIFISIGSIPFFVFFQSYHQWFDHLLL